MTEFASLESISRHATRGLCLVAMFGLVVGSPANAGDGVPQFQVPRLVGGPVFAPPPAPPTTFAIQPVPTAQPKAQPKAQPAPAPKAIPTPKIEPAPTPTRKSAPSAPGWVPRAGTSVAGTVRLYRCVKYKDTDEIPEDAIPLVIQVPDPRGMPSLINSLTLPPIHGCAYPRGCAYPAGCAFPVGCAYPRGCAQPMRPRMVNVKICVPRCAIDCLRVGQHVLSRRRIRYNFGDFKVDIRLRSDGWVEVEYDD